MLNWGMKAAIQRSAGALGYQIQRLRPFTHSLNVLELAVHLLLARQKNLFFVEIGANDGVSGDPLRPMILKYHLKGVLIEPNPTVFSKLVANYSGEPQLQFENVAVSSSSGTKTLYLPPSHVGSDLFATFDRDVLIRRLGRTAGIREIQVQTVPLGLILERSSHVDLLQIDAEGYDFEILKMVDFSRYLPAIVNYEHINLTDEAYRQSLELLGSRGYQTCVHGIDTIAIHKSLME